MAAVQGWLVTQGKRTNYMHLVSALQLVREEYNAESFDVVLSLPEFQELAKLYEQYCKDENDSTLKMFWNSFLEMVASLLSLIRATRECCVSSGPREKGIGSFTWSALKLCFRGFLHMTTPITHGN